MQATEKQALIDELLGSLHSESNKVRLVQTESPLGILVHGNPVEKTCIEVYPPRGRFLVQGVRSFNGPGEIEIQSVRTPGSPLDRNTGSFDSAAYRIDSADSPSELDASLAYYRAPWGWITRDAPLFLIYNLLGSPCVIPPISWVLYGTLVVEVETETPKIEALAPQIPSPPPLSMPPLPQASDVPPPVVTVASGWPKRRWRR